MFKFYGHNFIFYTFQFNLNLINTNSCKLPMTRLPEFNRNELIRLINNERDLKELIKNVAVLVKKTFPERYIIDNLR